MTTMPATATVPRAAGHDVLRIVSGLALSIPALYVGFFGLLGPTASTILSSMQQTSAFGAAQPAGSLNYAHLFADGGFAQAVRFTLEMIFARLAAVAILPPLLALAVAPFSRKVRWLVRLLFTFPLAMFAPVGSAILWLTALGPTGALRGLGLSFGEIDRIVGTFLFVDGLGTLCIGCAVGLIVGLAALRDPAHAKRTLLVGWTLGLVTTVAVSLQSFTPSYVLTGGGPANMTTTLGFYTYRQAFVLMQPGYGAATATVTLAALMLLGVLASLLVIFTGLRVELAPKSDAPGQRTRFAVPFLIVILLLCLFFGLLGALPALLTWLSNPLPVSALNSVTQRTALEPLLVNTWMPPLLPLLIQLPLVCLAALGIGGLRPLGKWSELLLLPFGLWLFVGVEPFSLVAYQTLRTANLLDTPVALTPPISLSVPMLFVLTLFFKGQASYWHTARASGESGVRAFFTQLLLPLLPLVVLLSVAALLADTQELLWPLLVATRPEHWTAGVLLASLRGQLATSRGALASAALALGLPGFVTSVFILGALQIGYLDRLTLRTGGDSAHQPWPSRQHT